MAADGRIIGEGFTSPVGGPHAEVNAFASVRPTDEALLPQATIYVSLEPCSHWGHTPPCCDLIISKHVKRCVCGCVDPFAKVQGRGIQRMRDAGIEVTVGVLEAECMAINRRFMTFNEQHRPYILLKWAQTANGYIAQADRRPLHISTPLTQMLSHKLRSENDAILVGRGTLESDRPQPTCVNGRAAAPSASCSLIMPTTSPKASHGARASTPSSVTCAKNNGRASSWKEAPTRSQPSSSVVCGTNCAWRPHPSLSAEALPHPTSPTTPSTSERNSTTTTSSDGSAKNVIKTASRQLNWPQKTE